MDPLDDPFDFFLPLRNRQVFLSGREKTSIGRRDAGKRDEPAEGQGRRRRQQRDDCFGQDVDEREEHLEWMVHLIQGRENECGIEDMGAL